MKNSHTIILFTLVFIAAIAAAMYFSKGASSKNTSTVRVNPDLDMTKLIVTNQ